MTVKGATLIQNVSLLLGNTRTFCRTLIVKIVHKIDDKMRNFETQNYDKKSAS